MDRDSPEFQAWVRFFAKELPEMNRRDQGLAPDFAELWNGQDEVAIGRLLRCHLLVEFYLTEYLGVANPGLGDLSDARLSFAQKLQLARGTRVIGLVQDGIEALNRLRNRMAHRLTSILDKQDLQPMDQLMRALREHANLPPLVGIELVEEFTRTACLVMGHAIAAIKELGGDAGALGYVRWIRDQVVAHGGPNPLMQPPN